jgi:glycogen synthase
MKAVFMTKEYPPHIYGGAGVHVEYLSKELAKLCDVDVRSFNDQNEVKEGGALTINGIKPDASRFEGCPKEFVSALAALDNGLMFSGAGIDGDVVHCHTWYAQFGGIMAKILYGIPLVVTVHSLEPLRPWKREQLGNGYDLSSWVERTAMNMADAIIAVSTSTKEDLLGAYPELDEKKVHVVYNGIDVNEYKYTKDESVLEKYGIDKNKPYVLFVGRMTRQKGFKYLLDAGYELHKDAQMVFCAGAADTPEMQAELEAKVKDLQSKREGVIWIPEMVSRPTAIALYSQAAVFCCPSIYEPFGIINLEAMACSTPVVAGAVGGIKEVVVEGETGYLVDPKLSSKAPFDPIDDGAYAQGLAASINKIIENPDLGEKLGAAGRKRVEDVFSWAAIARQTLELYSKLQK